MAEVGRDLPLPLRSRERLAFHSVQGSQYTNFAFGKRCEHMGVRRSTDSVGDACDNAMAESFFASLERKLIDPECFRSKADARMVAFSWLEGWYNPRRRHSSLGRRSLVQFEKEENQEINNRRPKHGFRHASRG